MTFCKPPRRQQTQVVLAILAMLPFAAVAQQRPAEPACSQQDGPCSDPEQTEKEKSQPDAAVPQQDVQDSARPAATSQESSAAAPPSSGIKPVDAEPPGGKRVFGVLPNYRTADGSLEGTTLTAKQKLTIASKDSFDYPLALLAGAFAGLDQLTNSDPSFGQGIKGYAHRFGVWYADEAIGNMFTEGIYPSLFHQDPRYFRRGSGSIGSRTWYAVSRVFVTTKDGGGHTFNYSEWLGNATAVAISQTYHPDNRTALDASTFLLEQVGTDAVSQVIKEFWPDIKRKWFHKGN
jgi:hypothetical protein